MAVQASSGSCTLPYPDKYQAAAAWANSENAGLEDEVRLVLYGLQRQADDGPCTQAKPWGWNVEESHKHAAWAGLGNMAPMEAMRLFVRTLEEEQPDWWQRSNSAGAERAAANGVADSPSDSDAAPQQEEPRAAGGQQRPQANGGPGPRRSVVGPSEAGSWTAPVVGGVRRPGARYEHAVALLDGRMFVVGGNCGGRYLSDTWVLDLDTLTWTPGPSSSAKGDAPPPPPSSVPASPPPAMPPAMPPTAGHALVPWQGSLLSIGGHIKASGATPREENMMVRVLDVKTLSWAVLTPSGDAPPARGSHSATLVGAKVWVFGGEDAARRPQDDVHVLDLADMSWSQPALTGKGPSRRSAHAAAAYADRWLLVFGGGSLVHCFSDLHVLDTHTGKWSAPPTQGPTPSARAGHAGAVLGDTWYIAGGGNNTSGCADLVSLDLSPLALQPANAAPADAAGGDGEAAEGADGGGRGDDNEAAAEALTWAPVVDVDPRSAIASEGLSLLAVPAAGVLVSFGGYNGKYHQDVHLFRPEGAAAGGAARVVAAAVKPVQQIVDTVKQPLQSLVDAAMPKSPEQQSEIMPEQRQPPARAPRASPAQSPTKTQADPAGGGELARLHAELEQAQRRTEALAAEATSAKETAGHELALMRRQLSHAQSALAAAEKADAVRPRAEEARAALAAEQSCSSKEAESAGARAEEARAALAAEQGRSFKLEAQVAELRQALSRTSDLERELERARAALAEVEASSKKGGGLFSYITGSA